MEDLEKYYNNEKIEEEIKKLEEILKKDEITEDCIQGLIINQKEKLEVKSNYYSGNIAAGNWSLFENDIELLEWDNKSNAEKFFFSIRKERIKDGEYEYIFIPSYYAVKILINYYLSNRKKAKKMYALKNAIVRRIGDEFYGGLPFILRYIGGEYEDERINFNEFFDELILLESELEKEFNKDDFIKDIFDCINIFCNKKILEKRIKDFNISKENYYNINYIENFKNANKINLNYVSIDQFKILMHRDVKKDWNHLDKDEIKKVNELIIKTPNYPLNDKPEDSEKLNKNLKGWLSQRIDKKDRLVYKVDKDNKVVYIATVCFHYDNAEKRIASLEAYK